jgi:hypothetical protein
MFVINVIGGIVLIDVHKTVRKISYAVSCFYSNRRNDCFSHAVWLFILDASWHSAGEFLHTRIAIITPRRNGSKASPTLLTIIIIIFLIHISIIPTIDVDTKKEMKTF